MNILYFDCGMGAAGDMLTAALFDLLDDKSKKETLETISNIMPEKVKVSLSSSVKCGITGSHFTVKIDGEEEISDDYGHDHHDHDHHDHEHEHEHHHHHSHSSLGDIKEIVASLSVPDKVKSDVVSIYELIADAEAHVHGTTPSEIHFHEVGTIDAVIDITSVCLLINKLAPEKIICSPIHVGAGKVRCAHGVLPVPAPATAHILRGIPVYGGKIQGELCTPTGAAILKHFVSEFGDMPVMAFDAVGYGMGNKDFEVANCVRVMKGTINKKDFDIINLSFNVDDMTPEAIAFATETLMNNGALDVFTVPIVMKKSRPGHLINVLCKEEDKKNFVSLIMKHTSTIGIREQKCSRHTLDRHIESIETPYGTVHKKISEGYGIKREKLEYEDLAKIARENDLSIAEITDLIK